MNKTQHEKWKNQLLGEVLKAMIAHETLKNALVFKGARILNIHLGTERQSWDIDSSFLTEFADAHPGRVPHKKRGVLEGSIRRIHTGLQKSVCGLYGPAIIPGIMGVDKTVL